MSKILGGLALIFIVSSFVWNTNKDEKETGIMFEHVSLEEAKQLAKETGKIIFIDAYAEWCGPCKRMAATAFKEQEVGDVYNSKFINLKIDCEKDADGPEIAKRYKIRAYPTLLFIDAEGKLVKSVIGMRDGNQLIALSESI